MTKHLHWSDRPETLKEQIKKSYQTIINNNPNDWYCSGSGGTYNMCTISEFELIKQRILNDYPERKEFYVMDLGSGFFGFVNELSHNIDSSAELPDDITVHVLGVRGERHVTDEGNVDIQRSRRCISYKLGAFAIENLLEELKKLNLSYPGTFDLIVSKMTSCHLHDPLGTFAQAYYVLRPGTGMYIGQGWWYLQNNEHISEIQYGTIANMKWLLQQTGAPYLIQGSNDLKIPHSFIIKKNSADVECTIPLSYGGFACHDYSIQGSHLITRFIIETELVKPVSNKKILDERVTLNEISKREANKIKKSRSAFSGSRHLFEELSEKELFFTGFMGKDEDDYDIVLIEEIEHQMTLEDAQKTQRNELPSIKDATAFMIHSEQKKALSAGEEQKPVDSIVQNQLKTPT